MLEPIKRLRFEDPDEEQVQTEAIRSAETMTDRHIDIYRAMPGAFGGRYIAADLFKETFPAYAATRETHARFNQAVHNASAVLSAELYRRVLGEADDRRKAVFLTGIPGAGKTTSVLIQGGVARDVRLVFEGQMWRPETTTPKLQQAIDAGLQPVMVVVHPRPEYALRNTFRRIDTVGRGASMATMADIQGGLPAGLAAVRERFADQVQLIIHDARFPKHRRVLIGWDNLPVLRSEGPREQIFSRLVAELGRAEREGVIGPEHKRQALGQRAEPRGVDSGRAAEAGAAANQREAQARARAEAFLTLPQDEGVRQFPELASAYEALGHARHFSKSRPSEFDEDTYLHRLRTRIAEQLAQGKLVVDSQADRPDRER